MCERLLLNIMHTIIIVVLVFYCVGATLLCVELHVLNHTEATCTYYFKMFVVCISHVLTVKHRERYIPKSVTHSVHIVFPWGITYHTINAYR